MSVRVPSEEKKGHRRDAQVSIQLLESGDLSFNHGDVADAAIEYGCRSVFLLGGWVVGDRQKEILRSCNPIR